MLLTDPGDCGPLLHCTSCSLQISHVSRLLYLGLPGQLQAPPALFRGAELYSLQLASLPRSLQ